VACGEVHSLAVTHDSLTGKGRVYSWGCASYGRLGVASIKDLAFDEDNEHFQHTPTVIEALTALDVTKIACGIVHSLAISSEGLVYAWGCASFGCLGVGDTSSMPLHEDGDPYQPVPQVLESLSSYYVTSMSIYSN